jgi:hypothetical protein
MDRINNKLPGDPTALVLAIVSLMVIIFGCCCGLFTIVSLTLSIIGLVMAIKSLKEYTLEPENYSVASYKNMNTAKIIGIIGIALSALVLFVQIALFAVTGERFSEEFWKKFKKGQGIDSHWDWDSNSEIPTDSIVIDTNENTVILKKQGDSIIIDSVRTKTQQ